MRPEDGDKKSGVAITATPLDCFTNSVALNVLQLLNRIHNQINGLA